METMKEEKHVSVEDLKEFLEQHPDLMSNRDLRKFQLDTEKQLALLEKEHLNDYMENKEDLEDLGGHLEDCDSVLGGMESTLKSVQEQLLSISWEIKQLQQQSFVMNIQLRNRKNVEKRTAKIIHETIPSPALCLSIFEGEIDATYLENLKILDDKYDKLSDEANQHMKACLDLKPRIDQLCQKAVSRIRVFLMDKMADLTKPNTNPQFLKTNVLLKYKFFIRFLEKHNKDAKAEIRATYIDMIGKYYFYSFRSYIANLLKLEKPRQVNPILIVPGRIKTWYGSTVPNTSATWRLDERHTLLEQELTNPIVCHIAKQQKRKLEFEEVFRSIHILLANTSTAEYVFGLNFFRERDLHEGIFQKSLEHVQSILKAYLDATSDINAVLLMIQITAQFQKLMTDRTINVLDPYLQKINMALIKSFKTIFDSNLKSLKDVNINTVQKNEIKSHSIIKRYALFSACAHLLNQMESVNQHLIKTNLDLLCNVSKQFLDKISQSIHDKADQRLFMIHSCDAVLKTFMKYELENEDGISYNKLLKESVSQFVESIVMKNFDYLLKYIEQYESSVHKKFTHSANLEKVNGQLMEHNAIRFKQDWTLGLRRILEQVKEEFPEQALLAKAISTQALTQVVLDYQRFRNVIYLCHKNPPFRLHLVSQDSLKNEWKEIVKEFQFNV